MVAYGKFSDKQSKYIFNSKDSRILNTRFDETCKLFGNIENTISEDYQHILIELKGNEMCNIAMVLSFSDAETIRMEKSKVW